MVLPVLGPDRTPVPNPAVDAFGNSTIWDWFHDVPGANYTVCRDIPLTYDSKSAVFAYDNSHYFPIDDIDPKLDPFNQQFRADDNKQHNFHFCLESHASFQYKKGQKFDFVGDDDVWVFINNQLVVDLGGVHGAQSASVQLDKLGLVEGNSYPFDFFFCERRTTQSHMKITTSLDLKNVGSFNVLVEAPSTGVRTYEPIYSTTSGQGCAVSSSEGATPGRYVLTGPGITTPIVLPVGVSYGGLTLNPARTELIYDSLAVTGLPAGNYVLRIQMASDTTKFRDFQLLVKALPPPPVVGIPLYLSHDPVQGKPGSVFPMDIIEVADGAVLTVAQPFRITPVAGLVVFSDSLLTRRVTFSDTLMTGQGGVPRRIWVRGDGVGTYSLTLRSNKGDSTDVRSPIVIDDRGLRWVDSLGRAVNPSALVVDVGKPVRLWLQSTQGKVVCDTCRDEVVVEVSDPNIVVTNLKGTPISTLVLAKGQGSFLLTSDLPRSAIAVTATVLGNTLSATWKPITWSAYHLVWTDSLGTRLANPGKILGDVSSSANAWIGVWGAAGLCTTCTFDLEIGPVDSVFQPVDAKGRPIAIVKLTAGKAKIPLALLAAGISNLSLTAPLSDTALRPVEARRYRVVWTDSTGRTLATPPNLLGDVTGSVSGWLRVEGVAGACKSCDFDLWFSPPDAVYHPVDLTGRPALGVKLVGGVGRVDLSLDAPGMSRLDLSSDFSEPTSRVVEARRLHLVWTDSVGRTLATPPAMAGNVTTLVSGWIRVMGTRGLCTACDFDLGFDPVDSVFLAVDSRGRALPAIPVKGGQARIDLALVGPGKVQLALSGLQTDSLSRTVQSDPYQLVFLDTIGRALTPAALKMEILQNRPLQVQIRGRAGVCDTCRGEVYLEPSDGLSVVDSSGRTVLSIDVLNGHGRLWVRAEKETDSGVVRGDLPTLWAKGQAAPIQAIAFPPDSGAWFDDNGDGKVDHLHVWLHHPWTSQTQIRAAWPDTSRWVGPDFPDLQVSTDGLELDILLPDGIEGTHATVGNLGRWSRDGRPWKIFPIRDRAPAVATKAILHRGTTWDTLWVYPSETLKDVRDPDDLIRQALDDGTLPSYAFSRRWRDPASGALVMVFPATSDSAVPEPGDWVRFSPGGKAIDAFGNVPGKDSRRVPILGTDRPPRQAIMYDVNGDGKADRVVLRFSKPLIAKEDWVFSWPASSGGLDIQVKPTADAKTDSGGLILTFDLSPYAYGSTSCPSDNCLGLGAIVAVLDKDSVSTPFAIRDGVAPVPVRARMRYTGFEGHPDTLIADFSEPVRAVSGANTWISWGDMVFGAGGKIVDPSKVSLSADGKTATFLVDTMVNPKEGQGIRINTPAQGGLKDAAGNAVRDTAAWMKLELGPIPGRVGVRLYHPLAEWHGQKIPASEPSLQVFVRAGKGGKQNWQTLDGVPLPDTTRLVGALLDLNGLSEVAAYVYDNMGVFVAKEDFPELRRAVELGKVPVDSRGNYQVWLAWNGTQAAQVSPSGIYLLRVVGWRAIGSQRVFQQKVLNLGWVRRDVAERWY
ncbi:MAG: fibro-slime domain-containing protein [Fibrobacteres bacterium]|nr:fibro-slime domain-containing protein [Fibrobacterota bacterium]